MAEYIERKELGLCNPFASKEYIAGWNDAAKVVRDMPDAAVAPVVCCKECKYGFWGGARFAPAVCMHGQGLGGILDGNDFFSRGIKKVGENDD